MLVTFVFLRTRAGTGHGQNQPIHREMLWNKEAAFNGKYREPGGSVSSVVSPHEGQLNRDISYSQGKRKTFLKS